MSPEDAREDDLDPLAPVVYGETPDEEVSGEDAADGGVSDSDGIVRVWLEDGQLSKVRVSPTWATRLGRRTLAECFTQALRMANANAPVVVTEREAPSFDDVDFSHLPPFDSRSFTVMQNLVAEAEERWDAAIERHRAETPPAPERVEGSSKGVTVLLSPVGMAEAVRFDAKWLQSAQSGTICDHVMLAARNAYARYVPGEERREELDDLEDEHRLLMATFNAMLNPKER